MKTIIKLLIVVIAANLLLWAMVIVQIEWLRIVLGLPFLLFFPGFSLLNALFVKIEEMDRLEFYSLSVGISIILTALTGFGLNYSDVGIQPETMAYAINTFIHIMVLIALMRRVNLISKLRFDYKPIFRLPRWGGSLSSKLSSILLAIAIILVVGLLSYSLVSQETGEQFSEVYLLGFYGQAQNYPSEFIMEGNYIVQVQYSNGAPETTNEFGMITIGIVNHYKHNVTYSVKLKIDGEWTQILYEGNFVDSLEDIELQKNEQWEAEVGFVPEHLGEKQKVEWLIFKDDSSTLENSLHFWIDVRTGE